MSLAHVFKEDGPFITEGVMWTGLFCKDEETPFISVGVVCTPVVFEPVGIVIVNATPFLVEDG